LSSGEGQRASLTVDLGDDDRDLVADLDGICRGLHGCPGEFSQVDQSLDSVGDLNESAERDQLGDLATQFLPHRDAVGECMEGIRLRRSQGQPGLQVPCVELEELA
jgi:hypothetical protein